VPKCIARDPQTVEDWLRDNPCPPSGTGDRKVHKWMLKAANACRQRRLTADQAFQFIDEHKTRNEKSVGEISEAVQKAYSTTVNGKAKPDPIPKYDSMLLAHYASLLPFAVTDDWLAEVSPECVLDVSPEMFLKQLYWPHESVCITTARKLSDDSMRFGADVIWPANSLGDLTTGHQNVYFLSNPVTGTEISGSWRKQANVTAWRYGVIETDRAPLDLWLRMLVQIPLPIAAIYTSGKRSVHCLFRVNAETKDDWDVKAASVKRQLVPVGACAGTFTAVRLLRLPGCVREETGQLQKLLYLNPRPEPKPLYEHEH
jgi:hypothetical protein